MFKFLQDWLNKIYGRNMYSTGALESPADVRDISIATVQPTFPTIPDKYVTDISNLPIENQGQIGSCVAQSHMKMIQYFIYKKTGKVLDLSARAIYKWCKEIDGAALSQGTYPSVMAKILRKKGIPLSMFAPNNNLLSYDEYININVLTGGLQDASSRVVSGYAFVPADFELIKQAIYRNGVLTATCMIDSNWFNGVIQKVLKSIGGHNILLIGYDEEGLYARNSWGSSWFARATGYFLLNNGELYLKWEDYKDNIRDIIAYLDIPEALLQEVQGKKFQFLNNLKAGDTGYEVYKLQERLIAEGLDNVQITGNFSELTRLRVINYQQKYGLGADGMVGPKTREKLNKKTDYLDKWCEAIKRHEGYFVGSVSYRNKNIGNLKYCGQKLAIGKDKKGFAIFRTYEDGYTTLKNMLINSCTGKSAVYKPTDTLYTFYSKYAPDSDNNNSKSYAEAVAKYLEVDPTIQIKNLI